MTMTPSSVAAPASLPERPATLDGWHARAQAMAFTGLPLTMNAVHTHTDRPLVDPVLQAAVAWDVRTLSGLLREREDHALPSHRALVTTALAWALNASPTVLKDNLTGIKSLALGTWAPGMTDAREVVIELLLGHGAEVTGSVLDAVLPAYHGPAVLDRLLAASTVSFRIPRTLGMAEGVLHKAASNPDHAWAVPRLVAAGADLNEQLDLGRAGRERLSPLGVAASMGLVEVCERLVALGADPKHASSRPGGLEGLARRGNHRDAELPLRLLEERLMLNAIFVDHAPDGSRQEPRSRSRL